MKLNGWSFVGQKLRQNWNNNNPLQCNRRVDFSVSVPEWSCHAIELGQMCWWCNNHRHSVCFNRTKSQRIKKNYSKPETHTHQLVCFEKTSAAKTRDRKKKLCRIHIRRITQRQIFSFFDFFLCVYVFGCPFVRCVFLYKFLRYVCSSAEWREEKKKNRPCRFVWYKTKVVSLHLNNSNAEKCD